MTTMTPTEMSAELQRLRELNAKRTSGKWRWQANPRSRSVGIYGGYWPFDLTVMDFVRWGMDSAMPRFRDMREAGLNLMTKITEFFVNAPKREHHADWFQFVNHPDAEFMCSGDGMMRLIESLWSEREAQEKRIAELSRDAERWRNLGLMYEDELPEMSNFDFMKWYGQSEVICGVRMGPVYPFSNLSADTSTIDTARRGAP